MIQLSKQDFYALKIEVGFYLLDKNTDTFYHIIGVEFGVDTVNLLHYKTDFNHTYRPISQNDSHAVYKSNKIEVELSSPKDKRGILSKTLEDLEDEYMFIDFEDTKKSKSLIIKTTEREKYEFEKWCIINKISATKFNQICLQNRDKILNQYKNVKLKEMNSKGEYQTPSLFGGDK